MGAFKFTLQTVLEVQNHKEKRAHKDLLEARIVLEKSSQDFDVLQKQLEAFDRKVTSSRLIDKPIVDSQSVYNFRNSLLNKIVLQKERMEEAAAAFEEKRLALLGSMQKRKTLEQLKTKHFEEWEQNEQHIEAVLLDDIVTNRRPKP